jgi:predicted nucleotidyltransferase
MKPSVVQKKLYGSVKIFWLNKEQVLKNLQKCVSQMVLERQEIEEVRLFGSLAENRAVPKSDVDLLIITKKPVLKEEYLPYFKDLGLPVDLFCYERKKLEDHSFARKVYEKSIPLWVTPAR